MIKPQSSSQHIIAVDDQPYMLNIIKRILENAAFTVTTIESGEQVLQHIHRHGIPHLLLVDLHMPMMSGLELSKAIREFSDVPIIMVTGISDKSVIIDSLNKYADDYITKPFAGQELLVRIRRVLRRMQDFNYTSNDSIHIDDNLLINFAKQEAIIAEKSVQLTPTETQLLYILVHNANYIITSTLLLNRVWPLEEATEDRLHVHIHRLRDKIEQNPENPKYIISERGLGYKFVK